MATVIRECDFCKQKESDSNPFISGNGTYICRNCIISAYKILFGDVESEEKKSIDIDFTPKDLKEALDEYVIGQDRAKKIFSVAVYNHYKRIFKQKSVKDDDEDTEIYKSNILLIGPTGSGKTLMAQTLAKFLDVPIAIADATSLTEAGYVGEDVENILVRLLQAADNDIKKAERGIVFIDEVDKISRLSENRSITRDVSGEGVQQALLKIVEGSIVNIPPKGGRKHPNQEFTQIDTTNILFICGGAFDGIIDIIKRRQGGNTLGFNQDKKSKKDDANLIHLVEPDDLVSYGLIPELIGRLHVVTTLNELSKDDMVKILIEPRNSLTKQYKKLFKIDNVILTFEQDAIETIAELAIKRKTGARGLRAILEEVMCDLMYNLPEYRGYEIVITKDTIDNKTEPIFIKPETKKSA
ncbi:MAG: ATP-dependent Clp protease ATP-binding subunit ClpX [Campylobacterales bacterium]|nr:ATP-dependent Clp protease ATP-binding subunit ClpX [Campylobacterales bacterium]